MIKKLVLKYFFCSLILILAIQNMFSQSDTLFEHTVFDYKIEEGVNTFSVIEVDSSSLAKYFGQTTEELLGKSNGLFVKQYGAGNLATLSIRGSSANQTQVFWNGIPVNTASIGVTDLTLLPIDFYNSLLIKKGGASLSCGSGGIGGAVCLNSNSFFKKGITLSAQQVLGSFGIKRTILKMNYSTGKINFVTGYLHRFSLNNFSYKDISSPNEQYVSRENASINQHFFMQEIGWFINKKSQIEFKLNYLNSWRQIPSIIGATNNGEFQNDQQIKTLIGFKNISNNLRHDLKIGFVNEVMNYNDTALGIFSNFNISSFHTNYRVTRDLKSVNGRIQAFLMIREDVAESDYYSEISNQNTSSLFVKWEQKINKTEYHLAVRQELLDFNFLSPNPSIGVKKSFFKNGKWNSEINASKTSRIPTLNDRFWVPGGDPNLLPENGFEIENNNRIYLSDNLMFSSSIFFGRTSNWIIWHPMNNGLWSPENVKEVQRYGLESKLEFEASLKDVNFELDMQYNYLNATTIHSFNINDASINKQLIYVPAHQTQLDVELAFKKVRIFYSQSLVGSVYIDVENNSYLPYYFPADIGIDWSSNFITGKQLVAGLKIINLFNEDYHIVANRPMPGTHFLINLKINLKK